METKPVTLDELRGLKDRYIARTTAALDDMWLCGFVPMAEHQGFFDEGQLVGFQCTNAEGYLLQFMLAPGYERRAPSLFGDLTEQTQGAFVSTAEQDMLVLCLDHYAVFEVHTLMYELDEGAAVNSGERLPLRSLTSEHLDEVVAFARDAIGAPEAWLRDYYAGLIGRREVSGLWNAGELLALGESRRYPEHFLRHAGLGVMVAKAHRARGLATRILAQLAADNRAEGLTPVCSTERSNVGSQKAITRAGFIARHRILKFQGPRKT